MNLFFTISIGIYPEIFICNLVFICHSYRMKQTQSFIRETRKSAQTGKRGGRIHPAILPLLDLLRGYIDIYYLRFSTKKQIITIAFEPLPKDVGALDCKALAEHLSNDWWTVPVRVRTRVHVHAGVRSNQLILSANDFHEAFQEDLTYQWTRRARMAEPVENSPRGKHAIRSSQDAKFEINRRYEETFGNRKPEVEARPKLPPIRMKK